MDLRIILKMSKIYIGIKEFLQKETKTIIIDDGRHAFFGMYDFQQTIKFIKSAY